MTSEEPMEVSEKGLTCAKDSLREISQVGSDQGGFEAGKRGWCR